MNVEVTQFAVLAVPVTLVLLVFFPNWLVPWAIVLAPFVAAAVVNVSVGGHPIGIQPGYFAGVLFLCGLFLELLRGGRLKISRSLVPVYTPLFLFVAYASVGAMVLPRVFEGSVEVAVTPRSGISPNGMALLHPSGSNVSQVLYVLFLAVLAFAVSARVATEGGLGRRAAKAYMVAGYTVVLIGFWQLLATYAGIFYPTDLLYSNNVYFGAGQWLGGVKRLSSSLSEPSLAGHYLAGVFAFSLWLQLFGRPSRAVSLLCALSGVALLLTTSTTAYLTLAVVLPAIALKALARRGLFLRAVRMGAFLVVVAVASVVVLFVSSGPDAVEKVIDGALLGKTESASYEIRAGSTLHGLTLVGSTGGFGVGWGSTRVSSLVANTLSNGGIWGTALLVWFGTRVFRRASGFTNHPAVDKEQRILTQAFAASVLAMLVAGAIAVADLAHIYLWLNLAVLVGLTVSAEKAAGEREVRQHPPIAPPPALAHRRARPSPRRQRTARL